MALEKINQSSPDLVAFFANILPGNDFSSFEETRSDLQSLQFNVFSE